jgi:hypothetical protein
MFFELFGAYMEGTQWVQQKILLLQNTIYDKNHPETRTSRIESILHG